MSTPSSNPTPVPTAQRHQRAAWRDPRLLVGVLILAGSVTLGAKVLASADDTVGVWAAGRDLPAGTTLAASDLVRVQVRFADEGQADRYLSADGRAPDAQVLERAVQAGELLPGAALGDGEALIEVPLSVEVDRVPATVRPGSVVDVYVTPTAGTASPTGRQADAVLALDDVVVLAAPGAADGLAPSGTRQVIVGLDQEAATGLEEALGRISLGSVVLTGQG
ncbi:hypothetical protein GCM10027425_22910 [Alteromonas gracilis]